jgi:uncharacterized protein YbjQ (UPF0145 family)
MYKSEQIREAIGAKTSVDAMKLLRVSFERGQYRFGDKFYADFDEAMNSAFSASEHSNLRDTIDSNRRNEEETLKSLIDSKSFSKIPEGVLADYAQDTVALTTSQTFLTSDIEKELGIVSVDIVHGLNILKDLFASITNTIGGRSQTLESAIAKAKSEVVKEIKMQTILKGGDGIISMTISANISSSGGANMLITSATGTAVKLK